MQSVLFIFFSITFLSLQTYSTIYFSSRLKKKKKKKKKKKMEFDPMNPLRISDEDKYDDYITLFYNQPDYMPAKDYSKRFDVISRKQVYHKFISYTIISDDPFAYLVAMNYFDRYISKQSPGMLRGRIKIDLSAICCFILALKMTSSFSMHAFRSRTNIKNSSSRINEKEAEILRVLQERTRPITALCFLDFFLILFELNDTQLNLDLKVEAIRIILISQSEIRVSEYLASVVAASALVVASKNMFPTRYEEFKETVAKSPFVDKEEVINCIHTIMSELLQPLAPSSSDIIEAGVEKIRKRLEREV